MTINWKFTGENQSLLQTEKKKCLIFKTTVFGTSPIHVLILSEGCNWIEIESPAPTPDYRFSFFFPHGWSEPEILSISDIFDERKKMKEKK